MKKSNNKDKIKGKKKVDLNNILKENKLFKISLIAFSIFVIVFACFIIYNLTEKVEIVIKGKDEVTISVFSEYKDEGFNLKSNRKNKEYSVIVVNNVNTNYIGTYYVEYVNDKAEVVKRKVNVIDDEAPTIELKGDKVVYICPNSEYKEDGYTISDNYDELTSENIYIETLNDYIKYTVTDNSNNKSYVTRNIIYEDKTKPKITVSETASVYQGNKYYDTYSASDNCDGDITDSVKVSGSVDTSKLGTYTLTYTVSDKAGNSAVATKKVTVKEKPAEGSKVIYLTFDDGPSTDVTPKILDLLKKYNIKATFFVINHGTSTDYLIKRAYDEGHTIGLHSYSHNYKTIYTSEDAFFEDLNKISDKVEKITGEKSMIMRFPGGSSNTVSKNYNTGIMTRLAKSVTEKGYIYFDWNVGSSDTSTQDSTTLCNNVKKRLGDGTNVVLMHDYSGHSGTYNSLECIIKYGLENGYTFDRITSSTKQIHHGIAN